LRARRRAVHRLLVAETAGEAGALAEILDLAAAAGVPVRRVQRDALLASAQTDTPQGVIAFAEPVPEAGLEDLVAGPAPFLVVLDGVTDPHSVGAVMRSALCAGATGILLGRHRASSVGPVVTKAAAGAVEHLRFALVPGIPSALQELERLGVMTIGLDERGESTIFDVEVGSRPVAVVLGAEGHGIAQLARRRCDVLARIPLHGRIDSLNVSAAGAVACFEIARQRCQA
jgi:23S rRNA (guanosine2251-2'-O)-methyltransferase